MARNIAVHIGIWCNQYIITYGDIANNRSVHADPNTVTYLWGSFSFSTVLLANGNTLMYIAIETDYGIFVNGYTIRVPNIQPRANLCLIIQINQVLFLIICKQKPIPKERQPVFCMLRFAEVFLKLRNTAILLISCKIFL